MRRFSLAEMTPLMETADFLAAASPAWRVVTVAPMQDATTSPGDGAPAGLPAAVRSELGRLCTPDQVVALGVGAPHRIAVLLEALGAGRRGLTYIAVDARAEVLERHVRSLAGQFTLARTLGLVGPREAAFKALPPAANRLFVSFDGALDAMAPSTLEAFVAHLAAVMRPGNRLLLSLDEHVPTEWFEAQGLKALRHWPDERQGVALRLFRRQAR